MQQRWSYFLRNGWSILVICVLSWWTNERLMAQTVLLPSEISGSLGPAPNYEQSYAPTGVQSCAPQCAPFLPYFLGDFFARGTQGTLVTPPLVGRPIVRPLAFTGSTVNGPLLVPNPPAPRIMPAEFTANPFSALPPTTFNGPGGPYVLATNVTGSDISIQDITILNENAELTALIRANFPGANFVNGLGTFSRQVQGPTVDMLYNYLQTIATVIPGQDICINLPNPAGGGLVGRNKYLTDNGNPLPQSRVFFFYNHVDDYRGLGNSGFDVNRYVLGIEQAFFENAFSLELRLPFAGTANNNQGPCTTGLVVDHMEFGNVGLALKALVYQDSNWILSIGLGLSLPAANDSRLVMDHVPVIEIRNQTCLVQPLLGLAWTPDEDFYALLGLQWDLDPTGNAVRYRAANGQIVQAGVLTDQGYLFASAAMGYRLFQNGEGWLSGVALQGELHYNRAFGSRDLVQAGPLTVQDLRGSVDFLNTTVGVICQFTGGATLATGVSAPASGGRFNDWNLIAQVNVPFGW